MDKRACLCLSLAAALLVPVSAAATPDPPVLHDARSVGMAGAGVAFTDSAMAIYHNPAALDQIPHYSVAAAFTPVLPSATAPLGAQGAGFSSGTAFVPLFFAGGALRLFERFVVGAAIYSTGGFGAKYESVPAIGNQDIELKVGGIEIAIPVSFRIIDGLSVAVALRLAYNQQKVDLVMPPTGPAGPTTVSQDLSGFGTPGVQAGIFYQPMRQLRIGLNYSSKISNELSGTATVTSAQGIQSGDARAEYNIAHFFRAGLAYATLADRLLLVGEFYARFYDEANDQLQTILTVNGQDTALPAVPLNWKNHYGGRWAAEFKLPWKLSARAGYTLANSAVPESTAGPSPRRQA